MRTIHRRLRKVDALRAEPTAPGMTPDREIVTYFRTGHRSSDTYGRLRHPGHPRTRRIWGVVEVGE